MIAGEEHHFGVGAVGHHRAQRSRAAIRGRRDLTAALERPVLGVVDAEMGLVALDDVDANLPFWRVDFAREHFLASQCLGWQFALDIDDQARFIGPAAANFALSRAAAEDIGGLKQSIGPLGRGPAQPTGVTFLDGHALSPCEALPRIRLRCSEPALG